jgi:hypothetical protein
MSLTSLSRGRNINFSPPRESLASDIPAGDGIFETFFFRCTCWAFLDGKNLNLRVQDKMLQVDYLLAKIKIRCKQVYLLKANQLKFSYFAISGFSISGTN